MADTSTHEPFPTSLCLGVTIDNRPRYLNRVAFS